MWLYSKVLRCFTLTRQQQPTSICRYRGAPIGCGGNIRGGVAQLGERVNGIHEVRGSIPLASIANLERGWGPLRASSGPTRLLVLRE
jgi:hypothetical protein